MVHGPAARASSGGLLRNAEPWAPPPGLLRKNLIPQGFVHTLRIQELLLCNTDLKELRRVRVLQYSRKSLKGINNLMRR